MKDLKQQVSYLQGLAEGLDISRETKEGKIISHIIEVLETVTQSIEDVKARQVDLETYLESIDDDLNDLEEDFYEEEDDDSDYVEVKCPQCNDIVCFDAAILDDDDVVEVTCPRCNEVVFINDGSYDEVFDHQCECEGPESDPVDKKGHTEDI